MFRLQVTIIRQTFQYMDMTCHIHVLQHNGMAPIKLIRKRLLSRGGLHEHKALETYEQVTRPCKSKKANEMS